MRSTLICLALSCPAAVAQDFIHYKFDSNCSSEVINYANGPQALASNGTLQTSSALSPFDVGVFGGCLAGGANLAPTYYNRVITGWDPATQPVTGDLTMAWFMRLRAGGNVGTSLNYLMGAPTGGFRLFTNGVAGRGLYQRDLLAGSTVAQRDFVLPAASADVQTLAAAGWVHIAMVVDATAQTADWYVNGVSVLQRTGVAGASITLSGPFQLGYYSSPSSYDLDEFLMSFRAYSAPEVLALSLTSPAGDGDYLTGSTTQCGSLALGSAGGRPSLGNLGYGLTLNTSAPTFYSLLFGFDRCQFAGSMPLPLDGGVLSPIAVGCTLLTDILATGGGVAVGPVVVPFPIPADPGFAGLQFFSQGVGLDLGTFAPAASNGFVLSVGY